MALYCRERTDIDLSNSFNRRSFSLRKRNWKVIYNTEITQYFDHGFTSKLLETSLPHFVFVDGSIEKEFRNIEPNDNNQDSISGARCNFNPFPFIWKKNLKISWIFTTIYAIKQFTFGILSIWKVNTYSPLSIPCPQKCLCTIFKLEYSIKKTSSAWP